MAVFVTPHWTEKTEHNIVLQENIDLHKGFDFIPRNLFIQSDMTLMYL